MAELLTEVGDGRWHQVPANVKKKKKAPAAEAALDHSNAVGNDQPSGAIVSVPVTSVVPEEFAGYVAAAVWMPTDALLAWEENPRDNEAAIDKVAVSIERFGFVSPICIWTSARRMVAGHTRLAAYRRLVLADPSFVPLGAPGPGLVPVRFHEFRSELEADAYALADNKLGEIALWNVDKLGAVIARVHKDDASALHAAGYNDDELRAILARVRAAEMPPSDGEDQERGEGGGDREPDGGFVLPDRSPVIHGTWKIFHDDVLAALKRLPSDSEDACFSDVPYGLGSRSPTAEELVAYLLGRASLDMGGDFMSEEWEIPTVAVWREIYRVLKPGAPVLSFAGSRTCDLITVGMRAAGFEVRDVIQWWYGTGFCKSLNLERAISVDTCALEGRHFARKVPAEKDRVAGDHVCPVTSEAAPFEGVGTGLKPAYEPCVVAMKPLDGTFVENALKWGVAGLAIDAARIGTEGGGTECSHFPDPCRGHESKGKFGRTVHATPSAGAVGRWPANVLLSHLPECVRAGVKLVRGSNHAGGGGGGGIWAPGNGVPVSPGKADADGYERHAAWVCAPGCAVAELDQQSGERPSTLTGRADPNAKHASPASEERTRESMFGNARAVSAVYADSGGASRFFYCAKASRRERELGCEDLPLKSAGEATHREDGSDAMASPRTGANRTNGARNHHPCVKPVGVTKYLAGLALPPRRIASPRKLLIPYSGSGSEIIGALLAGWDEVTAIERDLGYIHIAHARVNYAVMNPAAFGAQAEGGGDDESDESDGEDAAEESEA